MPDDNSQTPTPAQVLAGTPPQLPNAPLDSRPGQAPSLPAQPPAPPQPTPQQAVAAHHNALGQVTSFLFGNQRDPNTGEPVPQKPGALFRSLLAGALLGGAIGSDGQRGGGFISGLARGGNAVTQQTDQRQREAQQNAFEQNQRKQQMSLEEQRFAEEKAQHAATFEHWNIENLLREREADFRDRDQLEQEQRQDEDVQKWAIESNARLAPVPNNATAGNGPKLMRDMTNNPASFQAPDGYGRLLVKHFDFDGLEHDSKNGWTENGKPVDWSKHMQFDIYYVPINTNEKGKVAMSGSDWAKNYGVKGLDPQKTYSVDSISHLLGAATTQRRNERESINQDFKEKHDALNATISSARTNVAQYEGEKRELLRQGFTKDDDEVQEIEGKIGVEQKREQDAINEMHPRIRERVQAQKPQTDASSPTGKDAQSVPRSSYKVGDSVTLKNGQQVQITKINPNGTFQYR